MFLKMLEAKARDSLPLEAGPEYVERFKEMKYRGGRREATAFLRKENVGTTILLDSPELLDEEDLIDLLFCPDIYSRYRSAEMLTKMYEHKKHRKEYLSFFKQMLKDNTSYDESNYLLSQLIDFLSCKSNLEFDVEKRKIELASNRTFMEILQTYVFVKEIQYNTLIIILIFSYSKECVDKMDDLINDVIAIVKERAREKILRVCCGIVANVLDSGYIFSPGRLNDISKCTKVLLEGGYSDEELVIDIERIRSRMVQNTKKFCIRNYLNELFSGRFEDSEYHHKKDFWSTNLDMLIKNKVEIVKVLKKYLKSNNPSWICLACSDIFQLVRASPEINAVLSKYQVREILFNLINSDNDDIKFHAIQALYTCISSEWS
ncbi:VACUOLAR ATP SYNTHASE 54KDA SUBUNIT [Encephalitozoon cuniculi GB-M1]|uniref:VACUOLAR ATP SYNTHASE 54KDA SUBUNIT n=2 Tax=Encephalitozoon cuniculi TaxID=6035 RepID=Q8SRF3_ENCCU|nr:vacuolar H+-ATPase V1 sector subunit H [Encephalitozoon cuniculi GB-M1]AGE95064.1 vacuolar ATP synthase 54kDa subunit [Encephalitozoon cuniculi]KMV65552.1 vacuolar H+-ATPase V1 sector subunit H [Encephalitozoon cuniculi EcunIII-L]UYI26949.1 V-ATPase subunit H [Encephalitozoon cuniculi]CAD26330.1 VACUOLAR ATP SYNTHASE 54KDA SUBUNIT [Encephalitozoon cuniculi GB-M1]